MQRRLAACFVAGLVMLGACGGDDGDNARPTSDASTGAVATDGADAAPASTTADPTTTIADPGSCHVEVTGDVTATIDAAGGPEAVGVQYWLSDADTAAMTSVAGTPAPFFFMLSCTGADGTSVDITTGAAGSAATIPFAPAVYPVSPADPRFGGGGSATDALAVLVNLPATGTNWGLVEPGMVEITRLDDERISGTFTFRVTDVFALETSVPSKGSATITGEFDFANPEA
jgi:hypothetical protein